MTATLPERPKLSALGEVAAKAALSNGVVEPLEESFGEPPEDPYGGAPDGASTKGPSQATRLVQLATEQYELGVSPDGEPFAVPASGPRVVRMLRGGRGSLRAELARRYYAAAGVTPSQSALADACMVLEGMAQQIDPVELHLRVARHAGRLVLDLGDPTGQAVIISTEGWRVVNEPPIRFRRTALTGALPQPQHGGSLDALWAAINVAERYRPILAAVLVAALMPNLPHPVVAITGEQGTGKTTATRRIAGVLDPSPVQVRKPPRDEESATTAAAGSWMVALDNLSDMPGWLSDCLCRWSTGEGDVRRRLYTDGDLHVIAFRRAPIINGIDLGALRGDLAERLVHLALDLIREDHRRKEEELQAEWEQAHPGILGALLDLTVRVLRVMPGIQLDRAPRMADYAYVLAAVDQVLGTTGLDTYLGLAAELANDAVASDPVLVALAVAVTTEWLGTSAELLDLLTRTARAESSDPDKWRPPKGWPDKARSLTALLRRQAPALRRVGWTVTEIPRDSSRDKVLRWQLTPPEQRRSENSAANAATPQNEPSSLLTAPEETAANGAATLRQSPSDAASPAVGAATAAHAAPNAAPNAAPSTPPLTSGNEDHAATAAKAATNSHLLCSRCRRAADLIPGPSDTRICRVCAYPAGGAPDDDGDES